MATAKKRRAAKTSKQLKREAVLAAKRAATLQKQAEKRATVEAKKKTSCSKTSRKKVTRLNQKMREMQSLVNKSKALRTAITKLKKETEGIVCKPRKKAAKKTTSKPKKAASLS